ncbi:MAG: hypothetical protein VB118_08355 [Oscillospiraceae bacterium]|nr:hypothetical protein [Oscillospiraceae bacterium]
MPANKQKNKQGDRGRIKNVRNYRSIAILAVGILSVYFLLTGKDNLDVTLTLWENSLYLAIAAGILLAGAVVYRYLTVKNKIDEKYRIITSSALVFAAFILFVSILGFKFFGVKYVPQLIAFIIAVVLLYFSSFIFDSAAVLFIGYTFAAAAIIWTISIFKLNPISLFSVLICAAAVAVFAAFFAMIIIIRKKGTTFKHYHSGKYPFIAEKALIWPFGVTLAIFCASCVTSALAIGYEFYYLIAFLIWLVIYSILKSISIIEN